LPLYLRRSAESHGAATTDDIGAAGISRLDEMEEKASDATASASASTQPGGAMASSTSNRFARFPRFLRRTHSASAAGPEVPAYALFLRTNKRVSLPFPPLGLVSFHFEFPIFDW